MTDLKTLRRTTLSAALIASAAIGTAAHADTTSETAKFDARTNSYCVSRMVTGSIIPQRICATRQQWIDRGATITPVAPTQLAAK